MVHLRRPQAKVAACPRRGGAWKQNGGLVPLLIIHGALATRGYTERVASGYCTRHTTRFGALQYRNETSIAAFDLNTPASY